MPEASSFIKAIVALHGKYFCKAVCLWRSTQPWVDSILLINLVAKDFCLKTTYISLLVWPLKVSLYLTFWIYLWFPWHVCSTHCNAPCLFPNNFSHPLEFDIKVAYLSPAQQLSKCKVAFCSRWEGSCVGVASSHFLHPAVTSGLVKGCCQQPASSPGSSSHIRYELCTQGSSASWLAWGSREMLLGRFS